MKVKIQSVALLSITLLSEAFCAPVEPKINGAWSFEFRGQQFEVSPGSTVKITDEQYDNLPLFGRKGGWNDGVALKGLAAVGCSHADALKPATVAVKTVDGKILTRKADYDFNDKWATIGFVAGGRLTGKEKVLISYEYIPMRMDAIFVDNAGKMILRKGEPASYCPMPPDAQSGEKRLMNIYVDNKTKSLQRDNLFPVYRDKYQVEPAPHMLLRIPNTVEKLKNGKIVRILAWGDSVTDGSYLKNNSLRWQEQFVARLKKLYPKAEIQLFTNSWGGKSMRAFINEPANSPRNFTRSVINTKPDLVISEFVNDASLPAGCWSEYMPKVLSDFKENKIEWIILTPHYVRPDWMGLSSQNGPGIENDPRLFTQYLRKFSEDNKIALADAARIYGTLWKQGIPYNTLMTNDINHPNAAGMKIFADVLMTIFGEE